MHQWPKKNPPAAPAKWGEMVEHHTALSKGSRLPSLSWFCWFSFFVIVYSALSVYFNKYNLINYNFRKSLVCSRSTTHQSLVKKNRRTNNMATPFTLALRIVCLVSLAEAQKIIKAHGTKSALHPRCNKYFFSLSGLAQLGRAGLSTHEGVLLMNYPLAARAYTSRAPWCCCWSMARHTVNAPALLLPGLWRGCCPYRCLWR